MPVASAVVEIADGSSEAVLNSLARLSQVSVYGIKENQIVVVIEAAAVKGIEETITTMYTIDDIVGVYPVFSVDDE